MYTISALWAILQSIGFILIIVSLVSCVPKPKEESPAKEILAQSADTLNTDSPDALGDVQAKPKEAIPPGNLNLPVYSSNENLLSKVVDSTEGYLVMVFEKEIEDDFSENKTNIRFYRREGATAWVPIDSVILFEEGRKCFSISPVTFLPLGEQSGFFVETEAGRYGTTNAGLTERDYIFYVPDAESASMYRYVKWVQSDEGDLKIISDDGGEFGKYVKRRILDLQ